jgi:hypothetical protein
VSLRGGRLTAIPKPTKAGRRRRKTKNPVPDGLARYKEFVKEADRLWSLIIRSMNDGRCIRCGKPAVDPMHFVSRTYHQTRWDFWTPGGAPGCRGCHHLTGYDQHEHVRMVEKHIGREKWEKLNMRKHSKAKVDQAMILLALATECRRRGLNPEPSEKKPRGSGSRTARRPQ